MSILKPGTCRKYMIDITQFSLIDVTQFRSNKHVTLIIIIIIWYRLTSVWFHILLTLCSKYKK